MAAKLRRGAEVEDESHQSVLTTAKERIRQVEPFHTVINWIDPQRVAVGGRATPTIGDVLP